MYEDQTADNADVAALRGAARDGRAAAMSRRRALAAGRSALAPAQQRVPNTSRESELRAPVAIDGMAAGRLGRALSMQRRRQLSQGKQALGGDRSPAAASAETAVLFVHRGGAR